MGTLHVVATPIGNLEDVTLRALRVLREADRLFAEDTRRTRVLLDHHGIAARPVSLNAHNEERRIAEVLEALAQGASVALVSDAGTPLVSDPGARLVAAVAEAGHRVEPVPGPSALLAALAVCGLRAHPFVFVGFLPRRTGLRRRLLEAQRTRPEALVLFESPQRLAATLRELAERLGPDRRACVARELTKLHEEVARGTLGELAERFAEGTRGEVTLVVEGAPADAGEVSEAQAMWDEADVAQAVRTLAAEGRRPREIAARLARETGQPRRVLYARAVEVCRELADRAATADDAPHERGSGRAGEAGEA